MKKILQISVAEQFGGIEKLELEYVKYLSNDFQIDIMALNNNIFKNTFKHNIYNLDLQKFNRKNEFIYDYRLYKFLRKNKYDIIHINSGVFFYSFRVALIAKLCGIKKVVLHGHSYENSNFIKKFFKTILNPIYISFADEYLTCSSKASESLFTKSFIDKKRVKMLKNGVETEELKYNEETNQLLRRELNLKDEIVYGHVGRFSKEKNHNFLIDIFNEIQKKQNNSVLILIGDGNLKNEIIEKCKEMKLQDKVKFLGFRDDIYDLLNVIDVFIFPSISEGLGLACVEAQINGAITYCSTNIPIEAKITEKFKYFSLDDEFCDIAERICKERIDDKEYRNNAYLNAKKYGYEINDVCNKLKQIYQNLLEE